MISKSITARVDKILQYNGKVYVRLFVDDGYKWIDFNSTNNEYDYLVEACKIENNAKKEKCKRKSKK